MPLFKQFSLLSRGDFFLSPELPVHRGSGGIDVIFHLTSVPYFLHEAYSTSRYGIKEVLRPPLHVPRPVEL